MNRLSQEKSPYLLQHAHNPVNWYPWGEEAFAKARGEEKPVFLSIGYSTCHWCHVMERESFETEEAAAVLNRDFVAVKVDREERPDVDAVYMEVCQAMTGTGGWPLTILMTPEQKPFWSGTYLPLHSRYGQPGLVELLEETARLWREARELLLEAGDRIASHAASRQEGEAREPDRALLRAAADRFRHSFDREYGGFGTAPKFPSPQNLLFLMRWADLEQDPQARSMAETTLTQMARGGLFDQIGGGFSRYSTDEKWLAPHFEKMLYDNALLAFTYAAASGETGNGFYAGAARRTLDYVLRELLLPEGGFCCGQDADSGGVEGKYYLFTPEEICRELGEKEGKAFCRRCGIAPGGNFEGKSIPNLLEDPGYASAWKDTEAACARLYEYRLSREPLHRDDKVLTAWNALMIAALSKASLLWDDPRYPEAAEAACGFLRKHLTAPDGRLLLRWRDGQAAYAGQLDDYAFFAWALLELYAARQDVSCLLEAQELAKWMETLFWDGENGGFYRTPSDGETLISRPKELYDGAMPSGNSAAALVLVRLAKLTGEPRWQELADRQLAYLAGNIREYPAGYCFALLAFCEALYPSRELLCACAGAPPAGLRELAGLPGLHLLVKTPENAEALSSAAPFTALYPLPEQGEAYYLCTGGACAAPVSSLEELKKLF